MVIARNSNLLGKITVLVMVSFVVNTALALDGSGTQQDPWRIKSLEDFNDFAADANYWAGFTRLETDVNLAGVVYERAVIAWDVNVAEDGFQGTAFTGVFDGNDHKIMNLNINGGSNNIMGLFGYIYDAEVKNLGLEGVSVSVSRSYIGGLVGCSWDAFISNCYSTGSVNGAGWVGGLVGIVGGNEGNISNCYSTGDVNGVLQVGGLVGSSLGGFISNCYSTGSVSCDYYGVGGLVGYNSWGDISDCYSTGNVNGVDEVGGLVGSNGGTISNCYSTGDVNGVEVVGGLVGTNSRDISACCSTGNVNGYRAIGGLVGSIDTFGSVVTKCYSTSDVSGKYWLGGLVGCNDEGSISNCCSTGDVNGVQYVGGLVGNNSAGIISDCYSTGNISGNDGIGGLIGYNTAYVVTNCYSKGSVDGNDFVGGLVGNNAGVLCATYWDIETSGESNMCGEDVYGCDNSYGKTTAEMMRQSTYDDYWILPWGQEGKWDFINVWNIGENQTYPYLRIYLAGDINKDGIVNFLDVAITANQWMEGDITDE